MKHPECREDEVFLGNVDDEAFPSIGWKTKRRGSLAFDSDGEPIDHHWPGGRPVFVKREELAKAGEGILERVEKRAEACIYNPDFSFEGVLRLL